MARRRTYLDIAHCGHQAAALRRRAPSRHRKHAYPPHQTTLPALAGASIGGRWGVDSRLVGGQADTDAGGEALRIECGTAIASARVVRVPNQLEEVFGRHEAIRLDNRPGLTAEAFVDFAEGNGAKLLFIQPGKPPRRLRADKVACWQGQQCIIDLGRHGARKARVPTFNRSILSNRYDWTRVPDPRRPVCSPQESLMNLIQWYQRADVPFAKHLGIELIQAEPDSLVGELMVEQRLCTLGGIVHGGAIVAFTDTLGALLAFANLPTGATTVTLEGKTNFMAPAEAGTRIRGETMLLHRGRHVMVCQTRVSNPAGKTLAVTLQTQMILPADAGRR